MDIRQLQNQLRTLIDVDQTDSPFVSYFLDCKDPDGPRIVREHATAARKALDRGQRPGFDRAIDRIEAHVPWNLDESARSVAVFARSGSSPLFVVLEFDATIGSRLFVDSTPVVFPLVELEDDYRRYLLMICTQESARVFEVILGTGAREAWTMRPELRKRVGRQWTRLLYQNYRTDCGKRFLDEMVALAERTIVESGGHTDVLLAGHARPVEGIRRSLPENLRRRLVDVPPPSARNRATDVVMATLFSFVERQQQNSLTTLSRLRRELLRGGLAVCGYRDSREALERGHVDRLIALADGGDAVAHRRDELVKLAAKSDVDVEIVRQSQALVELGDVGCLLRYETGAATPVVTTDHAA